MPGYNAELDVEHSASEMFDLVADIERYPEFVPMCTSMEVLSRNEEGGRVLIESRMGVTAAGFKESVRNQIVLDRPNLTITVRTADGPFKQLDNDWAFAISGDNACKVQFSLAYEFKSLALRLLARSIPEAGFRRYADAFRDRADEVYGVRGTTANG